MAKAKKRPAPKRAAKAAPKPMLKIQAMPRAIPRPAKRAPAKSNKGMAMTGLVINVVVPLLGVLIALMSTAKGLWLLFGIGLGTMVAGKIKAGLWQLLIVVIGFVFLLYPPYGSIIGVPLVIVAWVWGIVTGVQAVKEAGCC